MVEKLSLRIVFQNPDEKHPVKSCTVCLLPSITGIFKSQEISAHQVISEYFATDIPVIYKHSPYALRAVAAHPNDILLGEAAQAVHCCQADARQQTR